MLAASNCKQKSMIHKNLIKVHRYFIRAYDTDSGMQLYHFDKLIAHASKAVYFGSFH